MLTTVNFVYSTITKKGGIIMEFRYYKIESKQYDNVRIHEETLDKE